MHTRLSAERFPRRAAGPFWAWRGALAVVLALGVTVGSGGMSLAHDNAELAAHPGPHGGKVQAAGNFHVETAIAGSEVKVWVTDHASTAQPTEKATGKAIIIDGEKRATIDLKPGGQNEFKGVLPPDSNGKNLRILVDLTMPGNEPVQVRYQFSGH